MLAHDGSGLLHTPTATELLPASFKFPVLNRNGSSLATGAVCIPVPAAAAPAPPEVTCHPCMSPGGLQFLASHAPGEYCFHLPPSHTSRLFCVVAIVEPNLPR